MLDEENKKLKDGMSEKELLISTLTGQLSKERTKNVRKTENGKTQINPSQQNMSLETRNRLVPLQNTKDEVLNKEA